jgi:translation initiation factor IF-1
MKAGKNDTIRMEATVIKALPNTRFDVEMEHNGRKKRMIAHVSGKMRMHFIKILPGDTVTLEINRYDLNKPRIVYRGTQIQNEEPEGEGK